MGLFTNPRGSHRSTGVRDYWACHINSSSGETHSKPAAVRLYEVLREVNVTWLHDPSMTRAVTSCFLLSDEDVLFLWTESWFAHFKYSRVSVGCRQVPRVLPESSASGVKCSPLISSVFDLLQPSVYGSTEAVIASWGVLASPFILKLSEAVTFNTVVVEINVLSFSGHRPKAADRGGAA